MLEAEIELEQETFRLAEEKLASMPAEQYHALYQQRRQEYLPQAKLWTQQALDQTIRARIIRELQTKLLKDRQSLS